MPPGLAVLHHAVKMIDGVNYIFTFFLILNPVSCVETYLGSKNNFTH